MADLDDVVDAVNEVGSAVERVHGEVSGRYSWVWVLLIYWIGWGFYTSIWESKLRYSIFYQVSSENVQIQNEPHDCEFLKAPVGKKYCHFDKSVNEFVQAGDVTKFGTDNATGRPVVSEDGGKTWKWNDGTDKLSPTSAQKSVVVSYSKVVED
jgi:hypothetical protein